jgi:inner membrane transporter RhtA
MTTRRVLPTAPPALLVLLAALSVQLGASLATGLLRTHSPLGVVTLRLVFGAALLLLVRRPRVRSTRRRAWGSAAYLGIVLACMNTAFYVAISRIPLGVAVTIEFAGPLAAALLGSRRPLDLVWVILAAAGIWILAGGRLVSADAIGVFAAAIAGLAWLAYIGAGARVSRDWPDARGVSTAMAFAALLVLPAGLVAGDLGALVATPELLLAGLGIATFSAAIPYSLEVAALGRLRPETYGILVSLEPAIAAVVGFLLLAQPLAGLEIAAIGCVVVASMGASLTARPVPDLPGDLGV